MHSLALNAMHLLLISCLLLFHCPTKAQEYQSQACNAARNYTSGSAYQQNLNRTLTSLAANVSLSGYYTTTIGKNPNVVYGLIQCRGYVLKEACQSCANTIATDISQLCPNQKEASIWNENCMLQYSDRLFFSSANDVPVLALMNLHNTSDPFLFNSQLQSLLRNITSNAATDPSRLAIGSTIYKDFRYIYAMLQCTRDISGNDCINCLQNIISYIPQWLDKREGGRIFSMSCNFRYETYSFFVSSSSPPTSSPSPSPSLLQPNSTPTSTRHLDSHNENISKTIVIVVIPAAVALVVISIIFGCFFWRKAKRKRNATINEDDDGSMVSLSIGLNTLRVATGNFSDAHKLGEGGFGTVYKGKLRDGQEIAVKRLSSCSKQGLEELKTEVMLVAKLLHRNLVWLLGFCLEEEEKLLVYEYLPNGSLDKVLFDHNKRFSLEWERRFRIIVGIARGLLYLHQDSQLRIIHRDLKASNILLDESMNPKISDFGLARLFSGNQTQGNTNRIAGTYGYMSPEYVSKGQFSTKSDVYSFGILVLEIVTGRKNSSFRDMRNIQSHAWEYWTNGTALEMLDPTLGDQWSKPEVLKCIHIGLLCVQEDVADRPTMSEIVLMLSSYTITSPAPLRPAFFISKEGFGSDLVMEVSGTSELHKSNTESVQQSINEISITELDPR